MCIKLKTTSLSSGCSGFKNTIMIQRLSKWSLLLIDIFKSSQKKNQKYSNLLKERIVCYKSNYYPNETVYCDLKFAQFLKKISKYLIPLKVSKSRKKNWNSQFFQKSNERLEKTTLRAFRIIFSRASFVFFGRIAKSIFFRDLLTFKLSSR